MKKTTTATLITTIVVLGLVFLRCGTRNDARALLITAGIFAGLAAVAAWLPKFTGGDHFYFYDAISRSGLPTFFQ